MRRALTTTSIRWSRHHCHQHHWRLLNASCIPTALESRQQSAVFEPPSIQHQYFWSSSASSKTNNEKNNEKGQAIQMPQRQDFRTPRNCDDEISELLDCSSDDVLDATRWVRAEACIHEALEQDDYNLAFEMIDRLSRDPHAKRELSSEVVYFAVQEWLSAYERYQNSARGEYQQYMYSALKVWQKVESYLNLGIPMETRTIHRILEATALVKSRHWNAPMLAETILERMLVLSQKQNPDIRPSSYTFGAVIAAWEAAAGVTMPKSKLSLTEAPDRALALLEKLKGLHAAGWGDDLMPDRNTYRRVMNLFAHKGDAEQVEDLLQELYERYQEHGLKNLSPTTSLFSLVLYAWSKSKDPDAASRAETILNHMLKLEESRELSTLKVTPFSFNIVMICWSRQRTKQAAKRAQSIFDRMVEISKEDRGKKPVPGSYAALIQTWSFVDPRKAEETLWLWRNQYDLGECEMRVDPRLFSMIVAGWFHSKYRDAPLRCDSLLQHALDGKFGSSFIPPVNAFSMTINTYCRTGKHQNIDRAEEILDQMKDLANSPDTPSFAGPSASSYAPVIHALTRLGRAEEAESYLREWFDKANLPTQSKNDQQGTHKKKDLNTRTFNRVLKAWSVRASTVREAADRAEVLLLKMDEWGIKPNISSFRFVLECRKRIQNEHGVAGNDMPNSRRILELLDREYQAGALRDVHKSAYLTTRRDLSLMTL